MPIFIRPAHKLNNQLDNALATFAQRFAGLPVRNSGTLGGNVANGSPIGDSMPLLIALGAHVVLLSVRGHRDGVYLEFTHHATVRDNASVGNLRHELVHPLLGDDYPAIPAWLNEGIASLYGSAKRGKRGFGHTGH